MILKVTMLLTLWLECLLKNYKLQLLYVLYIIHRIYIQANINIEIFYINNQYT